MHSPSLPSKACPLNWICAIPPIRRPSSSQCWGLGWSFLSPFHHHFLCQFPIALGIFWAALNPSALWQALYQCNKASLVLWETEVVICLEAAKAYYRLSCRVRGWEERTCQLYLDKPMSVKDMPHAISITEITRNPWEAWMSGRSQACRKLFTPETSGSSRCACFP